MCLIDCIIFVAILFSWLWQVFAYVFVCRFWNMSKTFQEIRLVFDRYIQNSLKSSTRKKRKSGKEIK